MCLSSPPVKFPLRVPAFNPRASPTLGGRLAPSLPRAQPSPRPLPGATPIPARPHCEARRLRPRWGRANRLHLRRRPPSLRRRPRYTCHVLPPPPGYRRLLRALALPRALAPPRALIGGLRPGLGVERESGN